MSRHSDGDLVKPYSPCLALGNAKLPPEMTNVTSNRVNCCSDETLVGSDSGIFDYIRT